MSEATATSTGYKWTVTITGPGTATISGIPVGTVFFVNEQSLAEVPGWSLESQTDGNGTISTTPSEVTFNNLYTPAISRALVLFKQDASTNAGIPGAYFYLLKLRANTDISDETVMDAFRHNRIDEITDSTNGYADIVTTVGAAVTIGTQTYNNVLMTDAGGYISVPDTAINFDEVGARYFFYEVLPSTSVMNGSEHVVYINENVLSPSRIITLNETQSVYTVTNKNYRQITPTGTEVFKTNDSNEPLSGAELDLYYREKIVPPTYSYNSPYYPPSPATKALMDDVIGSGQVTVPGDQPESSFTSSTYTYSYVEEKVPSAEDTDWIQSRTDNDYIYFRDYNSSSSSLGVYDRRSFVGGAQGSSAQNGNRSWIDTKFKDNVYGQRQEIDYDKRYWLAAQFTGTGKKMVEYAVWERFVDRYEGQDTVVWKIQPPDGYTQVRFVLYSGSQCVRTTELINFKLGDIYHKTSWGSMYRNENDQHCYFNVPVTDEATWSTYATRSKSQTGQRDKRQGQNGNSLYQADRYTPTQQKVIFHCNSKTVWHNIHIEFFTDGTSSDSNVVSENGKYYKPVGQLAPGYLMEPYAYAGAEYRINGYLTYELTIPAEAKYFRVNNGVASGNTYYYSSKVTKLKKETGRNNYGNYFSINGTGSAEDVFANTPVMLKSWNSYTNYGDKWSETYSIHDVESDYDYIYFEKPADWSDHVYAYFYAGGDLRGDNWQRATYSAWPGVAAVATEYVEKDKDGNVVATYHSDQYTYSYSGGGLYTSSADGEATNPETIFNKAAGSGNTITAVYKFRLPKSELKSYANGTKRNYDKVIFNDGLSNSKDSGISKTHETPYISFKAGAQYNANGTQTKRYSTSATVNYTKRGSSDDYIYIRMTEAQAADWDDMHITFYNSSGNRILQSGDGYVMEYSGNQTVEGTQYIYFRAAIPVNAAKFKLNNGTQKSGSHNKETSSMYEILRLDTNADNSVSGYTKDRLVYSLDNTALTLVSPTFTETVNTEEITSGAQNSHVDYTARNSDNTLYIRDTAGWNIPLNGGIVNFYDSSNAVIGSQDTYSLTKTVIETQAQATANGRTSPTVWYYIEIPENAVSFTVTHNGNTTDKYDVYPVDDASALSGSYTTGNMYYETQGGGRLAVMSNTISETVNYTAPAYVGNTGTRINEGGDYLYLVCSDESKWRNMTVTFTIGSSTVTGAAQYLNRITAAPEGEEPVAGETSSDPNAVGYWYRIAIPNGATAFTVTGEDANNGDAQHTTSSAVIYELAERASRYKKDYTLSDMQYRLPDAGTSPTLLYPVFTEDDTYSLEIGGQTITTSLTPVDVSAVEGYSEASAATMPSSAGQAADTLPVLYNTGSSSVDTVTYKWGAAGSYIYFDNRSTGWTSVYAHIGSSNYPMTKPAGETYYQLDLSSITYSGTNVSFQNDTGSVATESKTLTENYLYTPDLSSDNSRFYVMGNGHNTSNYTIRAYFDDDSNGSDGSTGGNTTGNGRFWTISSNSSYSTFKLRLEPVDTI